MENTTDTYDFSSELDADQAHVWHHLTQHQPYAEKPAMMIVSGEGMRVKDAGGNEYLDAVSGAVWTVNVGYGRERIAKAVYEQIKTMNYFAHALGNVPSAVFAEKLTEKMPGMKRVFFSNSGSEANEKAYKIVRQIAHFDNGGKKHKVLFRDRDYHGTTIAALSSSGHGERKAQYDPYTPGFAEVPHCSCYRCPFGKQYGECEIECAKAIEDTILKEGPDTVGGIVLEPITAGGGVIPPPPEYFPMVEAICKKYGLLLHIDEVVCGMGRTGKWFGYQHYGVQPDMVTMAKGLASGYAAISCTVTREEIFDRFKENPEDQMSYFRDISTFGGCTGGPAAALENLRILEEENLLENAVKMGDYAMDQLQVLKDKHPIIGDVRGKGLFFGIELVKDRESRAPVDEAVAINVASHCLADGVIIGRTNRSLQGLNNTLCFAPALIATQSDLDVIFDSVDRALSQIRHVF